MKKLALLGASGHGKVVADTALVSGWDSVTFFDDAWPQRSVVGVWPVEGDCTALLQRLCEFDGIFVSIGDCVVRLQKYKWLMNAGSNSPTLIHPAAIVSRFARLGSGTVVMAGAVVQADAVIGEAGIINTGASVDHDCCLADAVHICPGAHLSGGVSVGAAAWIGVGAVVKQGLSIGAGATIGAGAVVVHSVSDGVTVVGNPARSFQPS